MSKTPVGLWECASGIAFQKLNYLVKFKYWKIWLFWRLSPELYQRKLEYWIEGGLRMTADFIIGLVTCVATVINTVFVALSYLKGKEKE